MESVLVKVWSLIGKLDAAHKPERLVIGVGSGTTIVAFINSIPHHIKPHMVFIPTSFQSKLLLIGLGVPVGDLNSFPSVLITVDSCDQFSANGDLIKGGGGCLLVEKIVAEASQHIVIIAQERKRSANLLHHPIPIEVHQCAVNSVIKKLSLFTINVRNGSGKMGPIVTDSGNFILDIQLDDLGSFDVAQVQSTLLSISGVIETGLFLNMHPTLMIF